MLVIYNSPWGIILPKRPKSMKNKESRTVSIVGLGYVGLPLAFLADKKGYKVVGIDTDVKKLNL